MENITPKVGDFITIFSNEDAQKYEVIMFRDKLAIRVAADTCSGVDCPECEHYFKEEKTHVYLPLSILRIVKHFPRIK